MKQEYFYLIVSIERLHRLYLEVVTHELERLKKQDINNIQALILYNIGPNKLSVGELTNRGYYMGSNASYNLRKMLQNEYIEQTKSPHDARSTQIALSPKGLELYKELDQGIERQGKAVTKNLEVVDMKELLVAIKKVEEYWQRLISRDMMS